MDEATPGGIFKLAATKLIVADLENMIDFYHHAFGYVEVQRIRIDLAIGDIEEAVLVNPTREEEYLVLLKRLDRKFPHLGEVILAFEVQHLDAMAKKIAAIGGSCIGQTKHIETLGLKVAFVSDPEGHILELFEKIAA